MYPLASRTGPGSARPWFALRIAQSLNAFQLGVALRALPLAAVCFCLLGSFSIAADSEDSSLPPPRNVKSEESAEMDTIKKDVFALFTKRDFTALDALAERYRREEMHFSSGTSRLMVFYRAFSMQSNNSDQQWEKTISGLEEWSQAKPDSPTAKLALADVWQSYSWKARGSGTIDTVSNEGFRLMSQRLDNAQTLLDQVKPLRAKCPDYYQFSQSVALGQGMAKSEYDILCDEAEKQFPNAFTTYSYKCYYLQTKWYGKPGEWEAYLTSAADRIGGEDGDLLYARVVDYLDGGKMDNVMNSAVSWPRAKRGFEVMLKRYPGELNALSSYASVACKAGDWPLARKLFDQIGDRVSLVIWNSQERFVKARKQAFNEQ